MLAAEGLDISLMPTSTFDQLASSINIDWTAVADQILALNKELCFYSNMTNTHNNLNQGCFPPLRT